MYYKKNIYRSIQCPLRSPLSLSLNPPLGLGTPRACSTVTLKINNLIKFRTTNYYCLLFLLLQ